MVESHEQPASSNPGLQGVIRHQLGVKEERDQKNGVWDPVREAARAELVREENAKREAAQRMTTAFYGDNWDQPLVYPCMAFDIPPLRAARWAFMGLGILHGGTALMILIGEAAKLVTSDEAQDFIRMCVPVVLATVISVASFELEEVYRKVAKRNLPLRDQRPWLFGAALYFVFASCMLVIIIYRWRQGISWLGE